MRAKRPRLYFSFRSPYSWMAIHRLRNALPDLDNAMDWIPHWDPDEATTEGLTARGASFHYVQMSRAKHLYILMDTRRMAARAGLTMSWPIDIDPWWELPHMGWLVARERGRAREFYDEVTAARWHRGENVCTPEVLTSVACRAGLDPDEVLGAPDDPSRREEAVSCLEQAYLDDVFGIPYLKIGRDRYWGLDRVDVFLERWHETVPTDKRRDGEDAQDEIRHLVSAYDTDTAGGCG